MGVGEEVGILIDTLKILSNKKSNSVITQSIL